MAPTTRRTGLSRRQFLKAGAAGTAAGAVALSGAPQIANAKPKPKIRGPKPRAASLVTAGPELGLLPGFSYTVFGQFGSAMSDGFITPPIHDGMGVYDAGGGTYRIVRNHELGEGNDIGPGRPTGLKSTAWDPKARGCTTTMTVDNNGDLLESFISLNGTDTNCSGSPTPWDTWLTCEETTAGVKAGLAKPHGYIFEVDAFADEPVKTNPHKAMGRFLHEAAAVDPDTSVVYMTEDNGPDGFYRFVPKTPGKLNKGKVQILKVGKSGYNTVVGQTPGDVLPASWITITDPDPADAEDDPGAVYHEGRSKGAARFLGGEGCTFRANGGSNPGSCVFNSSDGGDAELQIWQYTPTTNVGDLDEQGELVLLYESTDEAAMQGPDNLCTSPSGAIIVAEDGDATNFLRALLPNNTLITIGENLVSIRIAYIDSSGIVFDPDTPFDDYNFTAGNGMSEFAGCRFSPDGKFLFVNIQVPGITCAITGPWGSIGL